jgi:hypothetical protein
MTEAHRPIPGPRRWAVAAVWAVAGVILFYAPQSSGDPMPPPSFFVSADACLALSSPCTCADLQTMQDSLTNQNDALDAWNVTSTQIKSGTKTAKTAADARTIFDGNFSSATQATLGARFMSCPGYDPTKNTLTQIAGTNGVSPVVDPCFCSTFCQDVVNATIVHEHTHVAVNVGLLPFLIPMLAACKAGAADASTCDLVDPMALVTSEIVAHTAGIAALQDSIDKLRAASTVTDDAGLSMPMDCTSTPMPPPPGTGSDAGPAPMPRTIPIPRTLPARLKLLVDRFVHGAAPSP